MCATTICLINETNMFILVCVQEDTNNSTNIPDIKNCERVV